MSSEIWAPIEGFPNYEVSSLGRVRNRKGLLSQHPREDGYIMVNLYRNGIPTSFRVNRLVCAAFNGPPGNPELLALHKDHVRHHNTPDNLYWGDQERNMADRAEAGRANLKTGEECSWAVLDWPKVREIRRRKTLERISYAALAREYGVAVGTIQAICSGKNWKNDPLNST